MGPIFRTAIIRHFPKPILKFIVVFFFFAFWKALVKLASLSFSFAGSNPYCTLRVTHMVSNNLRRVEILNIKINMCVFVCAHPYQQELMSDNISLVITFQEEKGTNTCITNRIVLGVEGVFSSVRMSG